MGKPGPDVDKLPDPLLGDPGRRALVEPPVRPGAVLDLRYRGQDALGGFLVNVEMAGATEHVIVDPRRGGLGRVQALRKAQGLGHQGPPGGVVWCGSQPVLHADQRPGMNRQEDRQFYLADLNPPSANPGSAARPRILLKILVKNQSHS